MALLQTVPCRCYAPSPAFGFYGRHLSIFRAINVAKEEYSFAENYLLLVYFVLQKDMLCINRLVFPPTQAGY